MSEAKKEAGVTTPKPKPKMKMASFSPDSSPQHKHPKYLEMIVTVLRKKPESMETRVRKGVGVRTLMKEIIDTYQLQEERAHTPFKAAFHHGLDEKVLAKVKGVGLSGSVRFHRKFIDALQEDFDDDETTIGKFIEQFVKNPQNAHHVKAHEPEKEKQPRKKTAAKETESSPKKEPGKKRRAEKASDEPKEKKAK